MAKKYDELTFNDDFMFCKILEQNPAICRELLELILDRKVGELARRRQGTVLCLLFQIMPRNSANYQNKETENRPLSPPLV